VKNVTLRQLRVFEAVARHLSFSRAAEELHLTQPAVSMQVRSLEESVGLPLTEQAGKRTFLTAAGAEVARHARLIAEQLQAAQAAIDELKGIKGGCLTLAVVSTAKYFAPHLLAAFRSEHPEAEVRLLVHNRAEVVRALAENEVDLAIMGRPPPEIPTGAQAFAPHPLIFVAAPGHPLAGRQRIDPRQLAQETLIIRESGSGTRAAMEQYLAEADVVPRATLEMSSNETIKQAVMAGMGIAFISAHTAGLELATGRLVQLAASQTPVMREWFVVHRADKRLLPIATAFLAFLEAQGGAVIEAQTRPEVLRRASALGNRSRKPL